jgi:predicted alpha/beta-fold hydrolase
LKDKGVVALGGKYSTSPKNMENVLIIIPGLCAPSGGVSKICLYAKERVFQPVVYNRRGFGDSYLTTPKLQCYGYPSDLRQVVEYLNGKYPKARITCVSYGIGSESLLSYMGEFGSSAHISAGVCVSASFDISHRTSTKMNGLYTQLFLFLFKRVIWNHAFSKIYQHPESTQSLELQTI